MEKLEKENTNLKINSSLVDIKNMFNSEIFKNFWSKNFKLGKYINKKEMKNSSFFEKNFIYKVNFDEKEENLQILISDFSSVFISNQNKETILGLKEELNPAIETDNINTFIKYLENKLFNFEKNSIVYMEEIIKSKEKIIKFSFESFVDCVKIKWEINCTELNKVYF